MTSAGSRGALPPLARAVMDGLFTNSPPRNLP
jgi:hypothetical protein